MEDSGILQRMGMEVSHSQNISILADKDDARKIFACSNFNISSKYHIEGSYDGQMSLPLMIAMLTLGFVTFFVNLGVIIRTIKIIRRGHDSKPSFFYIGNLALSDLAIGLYIIIAFLLHISNKSNLWQLKTCTLQIAVAVTACQETIFTIMLIAVDKYLYICHALRYYQIVTIKRVYVALILSWVISLIVGSLPAMGMHVQWEDTCGRCIFAQVVSKDFAILLFVTAVALPYIVIVSLYSILLVLAIKMQKARYGGSLKNPSANGKSGLRLTFISRTPTGFKSRTSTTKSTISRTTISTTTSNISGASQFKTNRRKLRKQAMQDYKASLPEVIDRENTAKFIETKDIKIINTNQNMQAEENVHIKDVEFKAQFIKTDPMRHEESATNSQESYTGHANSRSDEMRYFRDDDHNSTKFSHDGKSNFIGNVSTEEDPLSETKVNIEGDDVTNSNTKDSERSFSIAEDKLSEDVGHKQVNGADLKMDIKYAQGSKTLHNETQTKRELTEESASKRLSETTSSDSHISSQNLPPLESTDDEEVSERDNSKNWSFSKYFNRVVSDTRDKVLFLKKCQAVKTVFLIVGSFSATYVPFVIGSLVYSIQSEKNAKLLHVLQTLLYCAVVANSLANPLMYAYGYREFRIRTEKFKGVFAKEKKPKV